MQHRKKYQKVGQEVGRIKNSIIAISVIGMIAQVIILIAGLPQDREKSEDYSPLETCYYGMESLFNNAPQERLFAKKVLDEVGERKFKMERITLVKLLNSYACDVVVKDLKGFRSYRLSLEKDSHYKIFNVKEQRIISPYQWRAL